MAIKFFWMYIGSFFACSIALVFLVKSLSAGFAGNTKRPLILGSLSAIVGSGAAYFATKISDHLFTVYWILAAIFLLFGILQMLLFHKKYFTVRDAQSSKLFFAELMFAFSMVFFTIVIFSTLQYFLKDKSFLFYPMLTSLLVFFIPALVYKTFNAAVSIPPANYPTWSYPQNPIELPDEKPNEKLLVIAFEMQKKSSDGRRTNFRAKGPEDMPLGELFYHFMNDYNEVQSETPIEYLDKSGEAQEWGFRLKPKWYQPHRVLNPAETIRNNEIHENSIIICERFLI